MKAGDTVHDSITGDTWLLAFVDVERDEAAWCGWPEGYCSGAAARLTVTSSCSDEESLAMLRSWAEREGSSDVRTTTARRHLAADPREQLRRCRELMQRIDEIAETLADLNAQLMTVGAVFTAHFVRDAAQLLREARESQPKVTAEVAAVEEVAGG